MNLMEEARKLRLRMDETDVTRPSEGDLGSEGQDSEDDDEENGDHHPSRAKVHSLMMLFSLS